MGRRPRPSFAARAGGAGLFIASALLSSRAHAFEVGEIGDDEVHVDVTASTSFLVNVNNRNIRRSAVVTFADDDWTLWYNRLGAQARWGDFNAGVQIHSTFFPTRPDPAGVALDMTDFEREEEGRQNEPYGEQDADYFLQRLGDAGRELSNRYINWTYVPKYHVGYTSKHIDVTVGDVYGQLGRGLVLSIRKVDELGSDTTLRGGRVEGRFGAGDVDFTLTGIAGSGNPLRVDEASGRYIGTPSNVRNGIFAVTEAGMPGIATGTFYPDELPSYAPDAVFGTGLEGGPKLFKLGVQGSMVRRQEQKLTQNVVVTSDQILTGSGSLNIPALGSFGSAYVEVAAQDQKHDDAPDTDLSGHAVYSALSLFYKPVTFTFEGRHYRAFYPLGANVDIGSSREFINVQYSAPPTAEAFWVDTLFENFNTCVTGGRGKVDLRIGKHESVFAWLGYHHTWAERTSNPTCEVTDQNLNRVVDVAAGGEIKYQGSKSSVHATVGARSDNTAEPLLDGFGNETTRFYQEGYLRYDWIQHLSGPFSLQFIGWHRRRTQNQGGPLEPWSEGENLTGLQITPWGTIVFGAEYNTNPAIPDTYFNGQANINVTDNATISVFGGQRRGAIRCAAGVCRFFPPFEGGRVDATVRF